MAPLKVDCTSGLVIEILYYLNQVGVTSISLLNTHIATKRFMLGPMWEFCVNLLTPLWSIYSLLRKKDDNARQKPWAGGGGMGALRFD